MSTGTSMEPDMLGREAAPLAPTPIRKARTPRERCCASSSSTRPRSERRARSSRMPVVGFLNGASPTELGSRVVALRDGLAERRRPQRRDRICRRPWPTTRNANRHSNVRVGTTQRSIAAMASAWLRRNVRHVCDGGPRRRIMYLETVDSAISNPSLSSSPWMRGAPHNGFSLLIRWMSSRSSRPILGLPGRPRDFQRQ